MHFTISNHPTLSAVTRTADLTTLAINTATKQVETTWKINHFLEGVAIPELTKDITMVVDTELLFILDKDGNPSVYAPAPPVEPKFDEKGILIPAEPVVVPETISEYDYWMLMYGSGMPLSDMLDAGIKSTDSRGLIDSKCRYF